MIEVSICIPTYNGEEFIENALQSAVQQSMINQCEILLVDDCSTDNTIAVAKRLQANYSAVSISIYQNPKNIGLVANWNECIKRAKGKWIKFLFQDDILVPDCIEKMFGSAIQNNVSYVICNRKYIYSSSVNDKTRAFYETHLIRLSHSFQKETKIDPLFSQELFINNFLGKNFVGEPIATLFNKDLINKYGFFNNHLKQICDFEYSLRVMFNEPVMFLPEELVQFRVHEKSTTSKNSKLGEISVSVIDRIILGCLLLSDKSFQGLLSNRDSRIKALFKEKLENYKRTYGGAKLLQAIPFEYKTNFVRKILSDPRSWRYLVNRYTSFFRWKK
jgi:glycosyltransferase involved in cell wall biosynthesis